MNALQYPKPLRLPIGPRLRSKHYFSEVEARRFLNQHLIAEEKMDGTHTVIPYGHLLLFAEDLLYRKTIPYRVPARYALFDVLDTREQIWWGREDKEKFMEEILQGEHPELYGRIFLVPVRYRGIFTLEEIPYLADIFSVYGDGERIWVEGLVFKPEGRIPLGAPEPQRAKFVRAEFYAQFTEEKIRGKNPIDPNLFYQK